MVPLAGLLWMLAAPQGVAQPLADKDANLGHFYNLEYDEAIAGFRAALRERPEDLESLNDLAQALFYREMYRAGALESELVSGDNPLLRRPKLNPSAEVRAEIEQFLQKVMELARQRLKRDPEDAEALYQLGVAHGVRANCDFLLRKAWVDGLRSATTARRLHKKVTELDPDFVDAMYMEGIHEYVVACLPTAYRVLGFLVGFRGDRKAGIRTIQTVAQQGRRNRVSAEMLLCVIYRREKNPEQAVPLLADLIRRYPRNYLFRLERAQMLADAGEIEKALAAIQEVEELKLVGAPGFARLTLEKVHYVRGDVQFRGRRTVEAAATLETLLAKDQDREPATRALAWRRLGQIYDLLGERPLARDAYEQAVETDPQSEAAKQARQYLAMPYRREKDQY